MRWLMDACPDSLGWQAWLVLGSVVVLLWALAIAAATALFQASGHTRGATGRDEANQCIDSSPTRFD